MEYTIELGGIFKIVMIWLASQQAYHKCDLALATLTFFR